MISLSGIDCSGKSTQIGLICEDFSRKSIKYKVVWSRGGYTPGISFFKNIIRRNKLKGTNITSKEIIENSIKFNSNPLKRKVLFILSLIDLCVYYAIVLRLYEINSRIVICDRYIWDTYIDFKMRYPDINLDKSVIWKLVLKTMMRPKVSICLCIPADESMKRSELKEEPFPEDIETRRKRIQHYFNEIDNNRWKYVIDATVSIDNIHNDIMSKISLEYPQLMI